MFYYKNGVYLDLHFVPDFEQGLLVGCEFCPNNMNSIPGMAFAFLFYS